MYAPATYDPFIFRCNFKGPIKAKYNRVGPILLKSCRAPMSVQVHAIDWKCPMSIRVGRYRPLRERDTVRRTLVFFPCLTVSKSSHPYRLLSLGLLEVFFNEERALREKMGLVDAVNFPYLDYPENSEDFSANVPIFSVAFHPIVATASLLGRRGMGGFPLVTTYVPTKSCGDPVMETVVTTIYSWAVRNVFSARHDIRTVLPYMSRWWRVLGTDTEYKPKTKTSVLRPGIDFDDPLPDIGEVISASSDYTLWNERYPGLSDYLLNVFVKNPENTVGWSYAI